MVAAKATILMASEENLSNKTSSSTHSINRNTCFRYSGIRHQRNIESSTKEDIATCSLNISKLEQNIAQTKKKFAEQVI